jgi:hypothetical protein
MRVPTTCWQTCRWWRRSCAAHGGEPPLLISAAAARGLDALLARVWQELALKGGKEPISQVALPS